MGRQKPLLKKRKEIYLLLRKQLSIDEQTAKTYECYIYKLAKGNDDTLLFYTNIAFEKLGELVMSKEDPDKFQMVVNSIRENKGFWESAAFDGAREKYEKMLDKSVQKPKAVQGVYKCKNKGCSSDLFYTWSMQTRSGDEGMTHFRECAKCGKRGKC